MYEPIRKCLDGAVQGKQIEREQAEELYREFRRANREFAKKLSQSEAARRATQQVAEEIERIAARKEKLRQIHVVRQHQIAEEAAKHSKGFTAGILSFLTKDMWGEARHTNVEARKNSVISEAHSMFADGIVGYKPTRLGSKIDKAGLEDFVTDVYAQAKQGGGAASGNAVADAAARAWRDTSEYLRSRFNAAGGDIKKRRNWHVPQRHNSELIRKATKAEWVRFVRDELQIDIVDPETGMRPSGPVEEAEALNAIYETLATEGQDKFVRQGMLNGGKKLANKRGDPRTLQFLDAESWIKYNRRFGEADVYGMLVDHIESMGTDIARMEILGPNPDLVVKNLVDRAKSAEKRGEILKAEQNFDPNRPTKRKMADLGDKLKKARPDQLARRLAERPEMIADVYDVITGKVNIPKSVRVARFFGGVRNLLSTAQLGGAALSAATDLKFLQSTSMWNGLDASKVMKQQLKLLDPRNKADRIKAVRLGLGAEAWTQRAIGAARHQDEIIGNGWTSKFANSFHWATGLTPLTQANKWAFGLEFSATLADHAGKAFEDLPTPMRRSMKSYGIEAKDWDAARAFDLIDIDGAGYFNAVDMMRSSDRATARAGHKIHQMILTETDFAVPAPDARVRAMTSQGSKRGTIPGEMLRSTMMYKSFGITVMTTHMMRAANAKAATLYGKELTGGAARAAYFADLMIGLTLMGGLVINSKQIMYGRDPRDMTDMSFWGAALLQGGGFGILGDFVVAATGRTEDDLYGTALGPMYGLGKDIFRLTSGNMRQALDGKESNFSTEAVRFASRYTPLANLWYSRAATDHLIFDNLRKMTDPNYRRSFAKSEKYFRDNYNQGLFWSPGEVLPDRLPDITAVVGGNNDN